MTQSVDISKIVNTLVNDAKIFYSKAHTYRQYEELEGCLINLTSAANNLYQAINILNDMPKDDSGAWMKIVKPDVSGYLQEESCLNTLGDCRGNLEKILRKILEEIRPLQERLKRQKSIGGEEKEGSECEHVEETLLEGDNCIFFKDVVGCDSAKNIITESFINTFKYPNLYKNRTKSILFYGPPGTGKTLIVKAAINELKHSEPHLNIHFFAPLAADLKGKYVGETEKRIKSYFECASKKACGEEIESQKDDGHYQRNISILFLQTQMRPFVFYFRLPLRLRPR